MARHWAEAVAQRYLEAKGYETLAINYYVRGAELDLVMKHGIDLVIVEVRQRRSSSHGSAAASITASKLKRLQHAALHFMVTHYQRDDVMMRFDAVLVEGDELHYKLNHLQNILF